MPELADPPKKDFRTILKESARPAEPGAIAPAAAPAPVAAPEPAKTPEPAAKEPVKAPEAANPAPTADPDDDIIAGKRSPKSDDFKRVKSAAKLAQEERDRLAGEKEAIALQLAEEKAERKKLLDAHPPDADELVKARAERDQLRQQFDTVALEFSPNFQKKYTDQLTAALDPLKTNLPAEVFNKVTDILNLPDTAEKRKQLLEMTAELDEFQKGEVAASNREVQRILKARKTELDGAREHVDKLVAERQAQMIESGKKRGETFAQTVSRLQGKENGNPLYTLVEEKAGDAAAVEHNSLVRERLSVARAIYDGKVTPEQLAEQAANAAAFPALLKQLSGLRAELETRDATIKKLQGVGPGNPNPGVGTGGTGSKDDGKSFKDKFKQSVTGGRD